MENVSVSRKPAQNNLVWETSLVVLDYALGNGIVKSFELKIKY